MAAIKGGILIIINIVSNGAFYGNGGRRRPTSLPRSPTKMRKSFSGHSMSEASHHLEPPAARGTAGGFFLPLPALSFASCSSAA